MSDDDRTVRGAEAEHRYRTLTETGIVGVIHWHVDGAVSEANDAFLQMVGYTRDDLEAGRIDWVAITPPEYRAIDEVKVAELRDRGSHAPYEKEYVRKDGSRVPLLVASAHLDRAAGTGLSLMVDLSEQWAARATAEAATRRLALIADVSRSLLDAVSGDDVLHRFADALVPAVGTFAAVFVAEGPLLRRAAVASTEPGLAAQLVNRHPVPASSDVPVVRALRTGEVIAFEPFVEASAHQVSDAPEYVDAVQRSRTSSGVAVPLRAHGGTVVGVAAVVAPDGVPTDEWPTLQDIAARTAAAYLNVLEVQTERAIAERLQQALLPAGTPSIAGHDVGAAYLPAAGDRGVGGDWWDVIDLRDGTVALVVGDVSGHGVTTATVMAEVRNALRGFLTAGFTPGRALEAASRLLEFTEHREHATALVARYRPASGELVYSNAGHPPPIAIVGDGDRAADGRVVLLDAVLDAPLRLVPGQSRREATVRLAAPFDLLIYTDGLVESRRRPIAEGIPELCAVASDMDASYSAQHRAERLVAELTGTEAEDDICVVLLSRRSG
ncbi:MAG: SpoIIE family protein phosphatase [Jatrophihabitans sp.]|uniref:SpoIIE family protein phosphatase n=1 Tax=Jatrophihabitans sp. TaxID=1932789 RepID=UPI003F7EFD34